MKRTFMFLLGVLFLVSLALSGEAAMGNITTFAFRDFDHDFTGPEGPFRPDGRNDGHFTVTLNGFGALASISVRRTSDGFEWSPRKGAGLHGVRVRDASGNDISNADGSLPLLPFLGQLNLDLYLPIDPDTDKTASEYVLKMRFVDGSETEARTTISGQEPGTPKSRSILDARFLPYPGKGQDLVGPGEKMGPGGKADRSIRLEIEGKGEVQAIEVQSVSGRFSAWDTFPSNRRWLLGVEHGDKLLNETDGGVSFRVRGKTRLTLWLEDSGAIAGGDTTFQVRVTFADGEEIERGITPYREDIPPSQGKNLTFMGRGKRDLVGFDERLGSDGRMDWQFRLDMDTRGTLIGLTLLGDKKEGPVWDTLPGNRIPLVALTDASGRLLNRQNGSINLPLYGKTTLYLWVGERGNRPAGKKGHRIKAVFDDGRVLEFDSDTRHDASTKPEAKREIVFRARYLGLQDSDRVSPSEILIGDGLPDTRLRIYLEMPEKGRRLKAFSVETKNTRSRGWDTTPGNGRWAILVTDAAGEILNGTDGSIFLDLGIKTQLSLWLGDRGELSRSGTDFVVRAFLDDDTVLETPLQR